MTTVPVDQALYGYSDGHRLLASSRPISGTAGRLLRAVSDMAFDGKSQSYLTVLPIADLKAQAFIRSWPGPQDVRPGSVWSHVLLIDFVDLGHIRKLSDLVGLFTHPDTTTPFSIETFGRAMQLNVQPLNQTSSWHLNKEVARVLVSALYATDEPVSLVADIEASEQALLAILEQQWPRLRRTFSFRTRSRSSPSPAYRFDIEVVERARSRYSAEDNTATWVDLLTEDLRKPDPTFRELLRTFGAESTGGRMDMPALANVIAGAEHGLVAPTVVDDLCTAFPNPRSMVGLKQALLGRADEHSSALPAWPRDELARLALVFETGRSCLDLQELEVGPRLRAAWRARPSETIDLIARSRIEDLTEDQLRALVSAAASEAAPSDIARLAAQSTDLALLIARESPHIVESADLWSVEPLVPALLDILASVPRPAQTQTLVALLETGRDDAAASVCSLDETLWWDGFSLLSNVDAKDRLPRLLQRASTLRRVLERIGPAAVGSPPIDSWSDNELVLLAFCARPDVGLWRRAPADSWVVLTERTTLRSRSTKAEAVTVRLCALSLTAATQSGSAELRRRAWLASFGVLHRGLENLSDDEAWIVLQEILPRDPEWDRCGRLRKAAVETVVRDRWVQEDIDHLLRAVPEYGADLAEALHEREERKKRSRGWFLDFIDSFRP